MMSMSVIVSALFFCFNMVAFCDAFRPPLTNAARVPPIPNVSSSRKEEHVNQLFRDFKDGTMTWRSFQETLKVVTPRFHKACTQINKKKKKLTTNMMEGTLFDCISREKDVECISLEKDTYPANNTPGDHDSDDEDSDEGSDQTMSPLSSVGVLECGTPTMMSQRSNGSFLGREAGDTRCSRMLSDEEIRNRIEEIAKQIQEDNEILEEMEKKFPTKSEVSEVEEGPTCWTFASDGGALTWRKELKKGLSVRSPDTNSKADPCYIRGT